MAEKQRRTRTRWIDTDWAGVILAGIICAIAVPVILWLYQLESGPRPVIYQSDLVTCYDLTVGWVAPGPVSVSCSQDDGATRVTLIHEAPGSLNNVSWRF